MHVHVTTAEQSRARDAAAIEAGVDSFELMMRAGTAATEVIVREAGRLLASGVDVHVGSGNNGGDGYIVAAQLARLGITVRLHVLAPPATPDAVRAEQLARRLLPVTAFDARGEPTEVYRPVHVDALLGTGAQGALRPEMRTAVEDIELAAEHARSMAGPHGSMVFALDLPTGVNASTGDCVFGHLMADVTIMFGTCKTGALAARDACGRVYVVDIGLGHRAELHDGAPRLAQPDSLLPALPLVEWNAHKGVRGRVLLVGGTEGMSGAVHLAASGALASGAGLVRACVHERSVAALQSALPAVVCAPWPDADSIIDAQLVEWAHVVAIGPGLGRDAQAQALLNQVLHSAARHDVALVLDADALTVLADQGFSDAFRQCAAKRPVVITPHDGEFASLARAAGVELGANDPESRLEQTRSLSRALACAVLRKGTPVIVADASGDAWCVPRGSSALATGGTGDVLTGVVSALLGLYAGRLSRASSHAGAADPEPDSLARHVRARVLEAATLGAWVHGVAGEELPTLGSTVQDVIGALPRAWMLAERETVPDPNVLCVLPASR